MTYYLLTKGKTKKQDTLVLSGDESSLIGEESFGTFYPSVGFIVLNRVIESNPEFLKMLIIRDETNKAYTMTEFLDKIEKLKIKTLDN